MWHRRCPTRYSVPSAVCRTDACHIDGYPIPIRTLYARKRKIIYGAAPWQEVPSSGKIVRVSFVTGSVNHV